MEKLNPLRLNSDNEYKSRLLVALKAARICIFEVDLENQLYTFFENAEDIFGVSDEDILSNARAFSSLSPDEYQTAAVSFFSHPDDAEVIAAAFDAIHRGQQTSYEARMRVKDSGYVWCKLDVVPILKDGRPSRMIGVITDITETRKQKEKLEHKANLDGFTGLWNKKYSIASIRKVLEQEPGGHHALALLDVDGFKRFNDTYGHAEGDRLLLALSEKLSATFTEDSTVGRFGGDEFIVFIRNLRGQRDLDRLAREVGEMSSVEHDGHVITCSVGVSIYPKDGAGFEELFESADTALYEQKLARKISAAQEEGTWL